MSKDIWRLFSASSCSHRNKAISAHGLFNTVLLSLFNCALVLCVGTGFAIASAARARQIHQRIFLWPAATRDDHSHCHQPAARSVSTVRFYLLLICPLNYVLIDFNYFVSGAGSEAVPGSTNFRQNRSSSIAPFVRGNVLTVSNLRLFSGRWKRRFLASSSQHNAHSREFLVGSAVACLHV